MVTAEMPYRVVLHGQGGPPVEVWRGKSPAPPEHVRSRPGVYTLEQQFNRPDMPPGWRTVRVYR